MGGQRKVKKELEVVGFYLSSHPMDTYKQQLKWFPIDSFSNLLTIQTNTPLGQDVIGIGCGLIKSRRDIMTKKGDRMAFIQLEDQASTTAEIILFPKLFKKVEPWLDAYQVFIVKGTLDTTATQKCKIKANELVPLELIFQEWPSFEKISLTLPSEFEESLVQELKAHFTKGSIPVEIIFHEHGKKLQLLTSNSIELDYPIIAALEQQDILVNIKL